MYFHWDDYRRRVLYTKKQMNSYKCFCVVFYCFCVQKNHKTEPQNENDNHDYPLSTQNSFLLQASSLWLVWCFFLSCKRRLSLLSPSSHCFFQALYFNAINFLRDRKNPRAKLYFAHPADTNVVWLLHAASCQDENFQEQQQQPQLPSTVAVHCTSRHFKKSRIFEDQAGHITEKGSSCISNPFV